METTSKRHLLFKGLAVLGQLASLFPFAVIFEALTVKQLVVWHFFAIYAVWIVFRACGWFVGKQINSLQKRRLPKKLIPLTNFLSKIGVAVPIAAFIALGVWQNFDFSAYVFIMSAGIIIYFGGNLSIGRSYSDIFSRSWFVLDLVASIATMLAMTISKATEVSGTAGYMLCVGFAVVTLLSAVLANQTNIDTQTKQRDAGKAVLPEGLRRYNALLVIGIVTVTLGLFVFAKPLAALLKNVIGVLFAAIFFVIDKVLNLFSTDDVTDIPTDLEEDDALWFENYGGGSVGNVIFAVVLIAVIVLLIRYRKQVFDVIKNAVKNLFAPLFRSRDKTFDTPFADEITSSDAKLTSPRALRKAERELERRYSRETSPERKYRLGYALFLTRLRRTEQPPVPSDTTDAHREKGERAFGEDLGGFSAAYNKVRYADLPPTADELAAADELLRRIK